MLGATFQDILHNGRVGNVPCRTLREFLSGIATALNGGKRIARMPADGYDTATLMVLDDFFAHLGKRHAIQILGVTHLNASQLEAHHGGPVTTHVLHITGVSLVLPCQAIERIILMTKHIPFLL